MMMLVKIDAAGGWSASGDATMSEWAFRHDAREAAWLGRGVIERRLARLPSAAHGLAWLALAAWMALRPVLVATGTCH